MIELRDHLHLDMLTPSMRLVAEHCGLETASALVEAFGGARLWVPKVWREGHPLNRIGVELARNLIFHFGNSSLDVPKSLLSPIGRHTLIRRLAALPLGQRDIALAVGCTQRVVSLAIGEAEVPLVPAGRRRKVDPRQLDLEDYLTK